MWSDLYVQLRMKEQEEESHWPDCFTRSGGSAPSFWGRNAGSALREQKEKKHSHDAA